MENQEAINNAPATEEQPSSTAETAPSVQAPATETAQTEETFFDPKGLSPELEQAYKQMQAAFTKKTQDVASIRKKAESLDQLVEYGPFKDWYGKHISGADKQAPQRQEQPAPKQESKPEPSLFEELSDDEFQLMSADKAKLGKYLQAKIMEQASRAALPVAQAAQQKVQYLENLSTIERFGQEHPDFWDLDKQGLIEPLLDRHPGLGIEEVYKLAKFPFLQQEAVQKAHQLVNMKKAATVEKPGLGTPSAGKVKVKNREEAMALAMDYAMRGQTPPDFEIVRS